MILSNEWHEALIEHYNTNVRIRMNCEDADVCAIAKEEELHSLLLLECYNFISCQFVDGLDQSACLTDVYNASQNLLRYNRKYRRT